MGFKTDFGESCPSKGFEREKENPNLEMRVRNKLDLWVHLYVDLFGERKFGLTLGEFGREE